MYSDITGIILSGGKSSRMGVNKSLMKIGEITIIESVRDLMKSIFNDVILITNDPADYEFLGLPLYEDIYKRLGPLSGIHSGLVHSSNDKNFIISCDMPLMTEQMIRYLVNYKTDKPVTVARAEGFIQQLCGLYSKSCLPEAKEILKETVDTESRSTEQKKRGCRVLNLLSRVSAEIIDAEKLPFYTPDLYFNMNKIDDYRLVIEKFSK